MSGVGRRGGGEIPSVQWRKKLFLKQVSCNFRKQNLEETITINI